MTTTIYNPNNPPIKNSAFTFPVVLYSQADTKLIKTSPTLAAGDVKVGYEGQAPTSNITTLPSTDASGRLEVSLSAAEMNHNQVVVKFSDAAGAEWCDLLVTFQTVTAAAVAATDAPDAATIAAAVWGATTRTLSSYGTLVADVAAAVWSAVTRTLTAGGFAAADVWAYATRTLTQTAAAVQSVMTGSAVTILRGDTFSLTLTGLPANTGYVAIDFTVKSNRADADSDSIICVRKNASGLADGLLYLNGAAGTAAYGSITVVSATSITIALSALATDDLAPASGLAYDVQYVMAGTVATAAEGVCNINADVRRAVV